MAKVEGEVLEGGKMVGLRIIIIIMEQGNTAKADPGSRLWCHGPRRVHHAEGVDRKHL